MLFGGLPHKLYRIRYSKRVATQELPPTGSRGPRRRVDTAAAHGLLTAARHDLTTHRTATRTADAARDQLATRCAQMAAAGLSVTQVATGLGIHRREAQRLIERGRRTGS